MHDVDRTQGMFEFREEPEVLGGYGYNQEYGTAPLFGEVGGDFEAGFDQMTEIDLAAELLSVSDEQELDQFLGDLFRKVSSSVGQVMKSPIGAALAGPLKDLARKALPIAGGAIGGFLGGPLGASLGGTLASKAGGFFGLELEGLSPEDKEMEVAKRIVRVASTAAKEAVGAPPGISPSAIAQRAINLALQKHAPALARTGTALPEPSGRQSGRWVRRGSRIILYGI